VGVCGGMRVEGLWAWLVAFSWSRLVQRRMRSEISGTVG